MKTKTLALILLLLLSTQLVPVVKRARAQQSGGPKVDNLLINIYPSYDAMIQAFEADQIDLFDSALNSTLKNKYSTSPWNLSITLDPFSEIAMYQVDLNNNATIPAYPGWSSPTSFQAFRHGIAHLADKSGYVNSILGGYGTVLNTPVMPWMTKWHNQLADPHAFNRTAAALILDAGGFADSNGDGIRDYSPDHEKAGENLDPLKFFSPVEDPDRLAVAQSLTSEMLLIGIPVNLTVANWSNVFHNVIENRDFHLYVGKQDMYNSDVSADTAAISFSNLYSLDTLGPYGANYVHFNNTQFNDFVETLRNASDNATAIIAAKEAQRILAEQVGIIPLFARVGYKAHANTWTNIVNEDGNGIDNWWTFLTAHQENQPTGGTLTYGTTGDPNGLNPLFTYSPAQQMITDLIYESLLRVRDLSLPVSRIASDWTTDTWLNTNTGSIATKVVYNLNNDIYFHDGAQLTAEDVKFSIEYMKTHKIGNNYAKVANVHHVDAPDACTVVVYENDINTWALQWIGSIPIIPKHRWQSIINPNASMPEPTMTGSGPFKFVEYVQDDHVLLTANRDFLLQVSGDVNGDGTVNAQDLALLSYAYGSIPDTEHWNSSCDFNGDSKVDVLDMYSLGKNYENG